MELLQSPGVVLCHGGVNAITEDSIFSFISSHCIEETKQPRAVTVGKMCRDGPRERDLQYTEILQTLRCYQSVIVIWERMRLSQAPQDIFRARDRPLTTQNDYRSVRVRTRRDARSLPGNQLPVIQSSVTF